MKLKLSTTLIMFFIAATLIPALTYSQQKQTLAQQVLIEIYFPAKKELS